jgi:GNAT superfamily N-acetyltransferase
MSGARDPAAAPGAVRAARPGDVARIFELMRGLAEYERLTDEVTGTAEGLGEALFSATPAAECLVLEREGALEGYALFYPVFSSFRNRRALWLEDLYVDPAARGAGGGRRLMAAIAGIALSRGMTRIGWIVLDWNRPSIGFYQSLGGSEQSAAGWLQYALDREEMERLAQESPPA